jgi:hypothetical protein
MLPSPSLGPPLLSASWSPPLPCGMGFEGDAGAVGLVAGGAGAVVAGEAGAVVAGGAGAVVAGEADGVVAGEAGGVVTAACVGARCW